MCGRMLILTYDEVLDVVQSMQAGADNPYPDWPARRPIDVYPQDEVPLVGPDGKPCLLRWGYPVSWQAGPVFNTRIESLLAGSALWDSSAQRGRCLVPTRGFFERHATQTVRSPRTGRPVNRQYEFHLVDEPITWLAGVSEAGHFSVVTTAPNQYVAPVHDRMPLVLRQEELTTWMDGNFAALADRSAVELHSAPEATDGGEQLTLF